MELFKLEPGLAIWTWIAFGTLFFILQKFFFPSFLKNLNQREKSIARSIDQANEIEKRLSSIKTEYEHTIKKAREEAGNILLKTHKKADELKQEVMKKADDEAKAFISQARSKGQEERQAILHNFEEEISDFVCTIAEKVVTRSFTKKEDRELVKELLKEL